MEMLSTLSFIFRSVATWQTHCMPKGWKFRKTLRRCGLKMIVLSKNYELTMTVIELYDILDRF